MKPRKPGPWQFAVVVWHDWGARVSGVASAILTLAGTFFAGGSPPWAYWTLAGVLFVYCCYRAWVVERKVRNEEMADLQAQLDDRRRRKTISLQLATLYDQGSEIRSRIFKSDDSVSPQTCCDWVNDWLTRTVHFMQEKMSAGQAAYVQTVPVVQDASMLGMRSERTRDAKTYLLLQLDARLERLAEVMKGVAV